MDKKISKRDSFKKNIAIAGVAAVITTGISKNIEEADLSKYAVNNDKYTEYVDSSEMQTLEKLEKLDDNISKYEELSKKIFASKEEKEELAEITEFLKDEMKSGDLERFYLHDVFKKKIKETYDVDKVETRVSVNDGLNIKLFDEYGRCEAMEDKDKIAPIVTAMNDIVTLQGYEGKKDFSKSEVENFIKIQKNMKGFSNLHFIKEEGKKLSYVQLNLENEARDL